MSKNILLAALVVGVGVADYFLLRKSKDDIKRDIVSILPAKEKNSFKAILDKMNRQELSDSYQLIYATVIGKKKITDPALANRLKLISNKYNIFT
jgi:hypothetical protein